MQKIIKILVVVLLVLVLLFTSAFAAEAVKLNDLIEHSKELSDTTVTVTGEVIGEVLERGEYSWVNINDGSNAMGIWLKAEDSKIIQYFGDYKNAGDIVRVMGVFHGSCTEHGGDVDIHSTSFTVVEKGHPTPETITPVKIAVTTAFLFITAMMLLIYLKIMRFSKRDLPR